MYCVFARCTIAVYHFAREEEAGGARGARVARLNSRKDLRIRLEEQCRSGSGSSPASPSRGGASRSCTASPTPGGSPSSPRSSSGGSPKCRAPASAASAAAPRKLSLMAEELEGMRHVYLSPPPSPKLFSNINPQNTWEAFK